MATRPIRGGDCPSSVDLRDRRAHPARTQTRLGSWPAARPYSPAAIRAAVTIREAVRSLGIEVRQGLHTAEVELVGDDVRGIAAHEAARIAAAAAAGQILVSSTTRAVAESGEFDFQDQGYIELKGLSGSRQVFAIPS